LPDSSATTSQAGDSPTARSKMTPED
jgi:hypothetical protein